MTEERLVCARCGKVPRPENVALNAEDGRLIHLSARADRVSGQVICGGGVVPRGEEWLARILPGRIIPCWPQHPTFQAHLVRLGRRANQRSGSWTGTPLCGYDRRSGKRWIPVLPSAMAHLELCASCKQVRDRVEE